MYLGVRWSVATGRHRPRCASNAPMCTGWGRCRCMGWHSECGGGRLRFSRPQRRCWPADAGRYVMRRAGGGLFGGWSAAGGGGQWCWRAERQAARCLVRCFSHPAFSTAPAGSGVRLEAGSGSVCVPPGCASARCGLVSTSLQAHGCCAKPPATSPQPSGLFRHKDVIWPLYSLQKSLAPEQRLAQTLGLSSHS